MISIVQIYYHDEKFKKINYDEIKRMKEYQNSFQFFQLILTAIWENIKLI